MARLRPLPRSFFARPTLRVARDLIGALVVRDQGGERLVARIVECEAYREDEAACHAHANWLCRARGEAPRGRSALLFGPPGTAYVYFNYGVHWLFNVVTEPEGTGAAVLVRALEPLRGLERMAQRRPSAGRPEELCNGPGKLTQALAIGPEFNGRDLQSSRELFLAAAPSALPRGAVATGPRIGIRQACELPWRFFLRDHPCVSKGRSSVRAGELSPDPRGPDPRGPGPLGPGPRGPDPRAARRA